MSLKSRVYGDAVVKVNAKDKPEDIGKVDLVIVCVKNYDLDEADHDEMMEKRREAKLLKQIKCVSLGLFDSP